MLCYTQNSLQTVSLVLTVVGLVGLGAGLGGQGQGQLFTAWLSNDCLDLLNNILSINKLGNVEADIVNLVLTLDLGDLNGLGDTDLLWGWVGEGARDLKWRSHQRNPVSLGLVFLMTSLRVSLTISMMSICYLNLISYLDTKIHQII